MGFSTGDIGRAIKKGGKAVSKGATNVTKAVIKANVDGVKALQIDKALKAGAPIAATLVAGPAGGAVVSSQTQGGEMDFLSQINGFLGGNSALSQIANSTISGLVGGKPKPLPNVVQSTASPAVYVGPAQEGFDFKKWGIIGGGAAGVLILLAIILRRK